MLHIKIYIVDIEICIILTLNKTPVLLKPSDLSVYLMTLLSGTQSSPIFPQELMISCCFLKAKGNTCRGT